MTYVYLIESVNVRQQHYVGVTHDLKQRLVEHNEGKSPPPHMTRIPPNAFDPRGFLTMLGLL